MNSLKPSRVAATLTPVLAGITLAFNVQAANETQSTTPVIGAQHGQSAQAQQQMQDMRASKLIGTAVEGSDGKRIGEIEDLVIDLNSQRIEYAVLAHGGFVGVGEKLFAYPVSALQPAQNERLRIDVSEQKLKDAPGFDRKNWPDWNRDDYRSQVDRYYGGEARPVNPDENPRYVRASDFIGKDINDQANEDVGEVEELIVNMKDGSLHYVLVEFDNWHPDNDKLYVLAPTTLGAAVAEDGDLKLKVDRQSLANAPSLDKKDLSKLNDTQWLAGVKTHLSNHERMEGAVGSTPQASPETSGSPGGRVQTDRMQSHPTSTQ